MQQKEKKRDYALLLLLLFMICISGTVIYYTLYPYPERKQNVVIHEPIKPSPKPVLIEPVQVDPDTTSATATMPIDTMTIATTLVAPTKPVVPEPVKTIEENQEDIAKLRNTNHLKNISTDADIACFYDPVKKHLSFYPTTREWEKVYLIYPSPDAKSLLRRNLLYPDYESMVYPVYKKGYMVYNGVKETAVAVRINEKATRTRSYVIQAKSNPPYFIFGDYEDKNRWYIFENGIVRKFTAPSDIDAGLTEKL